MSLADRLREQSSRGDEVRAKLEELMREYAGYMRQYGVKPLRFMERTGESRGAYVQGEGLIVDLEYRPVGNEGWVVGTSLRIDYDQHFWFVIDTSDEVWFTHALVDVSGDGKRWWDSGYHRFTGGVTTSDHSETVIAPYYRSNDTSPVTWQLILDELGRKAAKEGIGSVVKPVEDVMIYFINRYRNT